MIKILFLLTLTVSTVALIVISAYTKLVIKEKIEIVNLELSLLRRQNAMYEQRIN